MPDLSDTELIAALAGAMSNDNGLEVRELAVRGAVRLTAAAEERERMELGHARLSAVRQSQYQAKEAEWIAEMEKRERAEASLTAAAERERGLRLDVEELSQCREQDTLAATAQWRAAFEAAGRDLLASVERERGLREALRELLAALDNSANSTEFGDDVSAMLRYGEAETAARAALAAAPEDRDANNHG